MCVCGFDRGVLQCVIVVRPVESNRIKGLCDGDISRMHFSSRGLCVFFFLFSQSARVH